jgi:glycosyltransferase involved in cell wall biosynthesis
VRLLGRLSHRLRALRPVAEPGPRRDGRRQLDHRVTHFQQSGTGRIGAYYNLLRVAPGSGRDRFTPVDEQARPGWYGCRLAETGCGTGPGRADAVERAVGDPSIRFLDDVDDEEKAPLMHACRSYLLPTKPTRQFTETFGIAAAEKMLAGGLGPIITTDCGGIREATGGHCLEHAPGDVDGLRARLDQLGCMSVGERAVLSARARAFALQFDRADVFDALLDKVRTTATFPRAGVAV